MPDTMIEVDERGFGIWFDDGSARVGTGKCLHGLHRFPECEHRHSDVGGAFLSEDQSPAVAFYFGKMSKHRGACVSNIAWRIIVAGACAPGSGNHGFLLGKFGPIG